MQRGLENCPREPAPSRFFRFIPEPAPFRFAQPPDSRHQIQITASRDRGGLLANLVPGVRRPTLRTQNYFQGTPLSILQRCGLPVAGYLPDVAAITFATGFGPLFSFSEWWSAAYSCASMIQPMSFSSRETDLKNRPTASPSGQDRSSGSMTPS